MVTKQRSKAKSAQGAGTEISSARELQQQAQAALSAAPILKSEKDGRLYAIAMLEALEEVGDDLAGADTEGEEYASKGGTLTMNIYRTAPQATPARKWIEELYRYGTPDAIAGFYVVVSHFFACSTHGTPSLEYFREREDAGEWPPAGSVIYRDQKAAEAAIAAGKDQYEIILSPEESQKRAEQKRERDRQMEESLSEYREQQQEATLQRAARDAVRNAAAEEEKRAPTKWANGEPAADELDTATAMQFHALIDIAKQCGKRDALTAFTVREAVLALSGQVRDAVVIFAAMVGKHPARKEVQRAQSALEAMKLFIEEMDCSENEEKTSVWHGRLIHAFTLDAARALERAQVAISGKPYVGWLGESQEWGME